MENELVVAETKIKKVEVLEEALNKIEGILSSPRTASNNSAFCMELLKYNEELFRLSNAHPRAITEKQFDYYYDKSRKVTEGYEKWNS